MSGEGWLIDQDGYWIRRFHRDSQSWARYPKVYVDVGRVMPNGEPALLKSRRHLRREEAEQLWKLLRKEGWKQTTPAW